MCLIVKETKERKQNLDRFSITKNNVEVIPASEEKIKRMEALSKELGEKYKDILEKYKK